MTYEYINDNDEYANRNLVTSSSNFISDTHNEFDGLLKPGTYFVVLSLKNQSTNDCTIPYAFNISLSKSNVGYSNVSIADLRFNKGLGAVA